jgi:tetratricopeptide (TPR) repeat protein
VDAENRRLEGELEKVQKALGARQVALQNAAKLSELIDRGEREAVIEEIPSIDREELSPLETRYLDETAGRFRTELSMRLFQEGIEHSRAKRYVDAVASFQRALDLVESNGHTARVRMHMADALRLDGKRDEAIAVLRELLDSDLLDRELVAESRWNLALCFAETAKRDESRRELLYVINKFPQSHWARIARRKLLEVNQME